MSEGTKETVLTPRERVFDFAKASFEGEINVSTNPKKVKLHQARMRRATNEELVMRERESTFETKQVSSTESERLDNNTGPNARLFDKVVTELKGYRLKSEDPSLSREFRTPTPELLAAIPSNHKSRFVEGMYIVDAEFVDENEDETVLGGDMVLPVDFFIGFQDDPSSIVRFELPECDEDERSKFEKRANQLRDVAGSRMRHSKVVTNLQASIDFFVDLMNRPGASVSENGVVNGVSFSQAPDKRAWASQLDPVYMSLIINTAFTKYNAKRQD